MPWASTMAETLKIGSCLEYINKAESIQNKTAPRNKEPDIRTDMTRPSTTVLVASVTTRLKER